MEISMLIFKMFLPLSTLLTWMRVEEPAPGISTSESSQSPVTFTAIPKALVFISGIEKHWFNVRGRNYFLRFFFLGESFKNFDS